MGIQDQLNQYRGGQLLSIMMLEGELLQCKLEMKVYNTLSIPVEISSIIVSLIDDTGQPLQQENFYEKELQVRKIRWVKPFVVNE